MVGLSLFVLSPFEARLDGELLNFATHKAEALLVYLALESDRAHRRDVLTGLFWPDEPKAHAFHNLRQALSHIRQALPKTGKNNETPFIIADRETLRFAMHSDVEVDFKRFEALYSACSTHSHRRLGACRPCLERLEAAVHLYRGAFLENFPLDGGEGFEDWVLFKREWVHIRVIEALTTLALYAERRGDLARARVLLQKQVELEPWREEAHQHLMRLYVLEGQTSAALAQYEICRQILWEEFAVEPSAETVALLTQIKDFRQRSGAIFAPVLSPATTFPLMGYVQLPLEPDSFVGREADRAALAERLAHPDCRLLTLTGRGGVGKTRLALQVAADAVGLFADGVFFVPLEALRSPAQVASAISVAMGLPNVEQAEALQQLLAHLRGKELLLVLDNFEHVLEACPVLIAVLRYAPGVVLLVTSRERLHLREEALYEVEGLCILDGLSGAHPPAETCDAVALFERRVQQLQAHFSLTPEVLPDVIRICKVVEGLPLAIELAAAMTAYQSCAEIATHLEQSLDILATSLRNVPERQMSLRAVFDHSWALLTPEEWAVLSGLTVFEDGFTAAAAHAVICENPDTLSALVAKSLLRRTRNGRYGYHATTHAYAAARLAENADRQRQMERRHGVYFAAWLRRELATTPDDEAFSSWEQDRANIHVAWTRAVTRRHWAIIAEMVEAVGLFYRRRGPLDEGIALFEAALMQLPADAQDLSTLLVRLQIEQARLWDASGHYEQAIVLSQRIIAESSRLSTHELEGEGQFILGQALQRQGSYQDAEQALNQALALARTSKQRRLESDSLRILGNIAARRGAFDLARQLYEAAAECYTALGHVRGEGAVFNNLGVLLLQVGEYSEARGALLAARARYRSLGDRLGEAKALNNLANVAVEQGECGEALSLYQEALEIHRAMQNAEGRATTLNNLGALFWEFGLYAEAQDAYSQALEIFHASGNLQAEGETLGNLSMLELCLGNMRRALVTARRAINTSQQSHDLVSLANTYTYLGRIQIALGELDTAAAAYHQALALRENVPHRGHTLEALAGLAVVIWRTQGPSRGLQEIESLLEALKLPEALEGADDPAWVYWACYQILAANNDPRGPKLLSEVQQRILERANRISNPEHRHAFLNNVTIHRQIMMSGH
ncbi:MAG: tetratricopeptide repeat protein [Anaerolineae bacterium]|nr:tetratricopeptide repeat protein [Anaerolineae bacterium]